MVSLAQIPGNRIARSSWPSRRILVTEIPRSDAVPGNDVFAWDGRRFDRWWTAPASVNTRSSPNAASIGHRIPTIRLLSLDTDIYYLVKRSAWQIEFYLYFFLFSDSRNPAKFHVSHLFLGSSDYLFLSSPLQSTVRLTNLFPTIKLFVCYKYCVLYKFEIL